jgi:flagellar motility protein MotE (MotC chaperone)
MMPRLIDAQQADAVRRPPVLGLATAAAAALLIALSPAWAQTTDPVVARVNGAEIRASDVAVAEEDLGEQLAQMPPEAKREYVVTYLSDTLLVAQAAEKKKLGDSENFKRRLAFLRNKLLSEALLDEDAKSAVTDDAMRKIYDEAAKKMGGEQEVHARRSPRTRAAPRAAISAISPKTRWCRSLPRWPSSSSPASFPTP